MKKLFVLMAVTAIALAGFSSMAGATLTFNLGITNLGPLPGPYVRVDVTRLTANTATVQFTSLANGGYFYLLGDGGSVAANVNAGSWTLTNVVGTNSYAGFAPGPFSNAGAGNEDGFGSFNQKVDSFDGYTHSSDQITLSLTNNSGTWANDAAVLTGNGSGFRAAAHIFVTQNPPVVTGSAIVTGFATEGGGNTVPEPTSMLLLGLGLVGAGAARRRKKS